MTPSRPYLIRALYEWIVDNDLTPYVLVDATAEALDAPMEYADSGKLVLNLAPRAVQALNLGNDGIAFNARFGGVPRAVWVPAMAVMAIYARENGQGMLFTDEDGGGNGPSGGGTTPSAGGGGDRKPALKVVK